MGDWMRRLVRRKWLLVTGAAALVVVVTLFVIAALALRGDALTSRVTSAMAAALNCDVSMNKLSVQFLPTIRVSGANLAIRLKNRPDLPAFVTVERFDVGLGLLSVIRRHISEVHLDGLQIHVPPRLLDIADSIGTNPLLPARDLFRIDRIITHDAIVDFVARHAGGRPLMLDVHSLELFDAGVARPMRFVADLTNPIPEGVVFARGTFGPWNRTDPTITPLDGSYHLANADLATINGISGKTTSTGSFAGSLTEIRATGTSDTPDFSLDLGGKPVPLATAFQVTVDGTDGTTRLDRVDAHLANTTILVTGMITNLPGPKNHDIAVKAEVRDGHMEDLMRLTFDTPQPIMTGKVTLSAAVRLPPGKSRARQRMDVSGTFGLVGGHFSDARMDAKLRELSRRGRGKSEADAPEAVATDFTGTFTLKESVVTLSKAEFRVPGATINISGTHALGSEELDFSGEARLEASFSKAVGGFKSIFLKPLNPLFRKDGAGAVIPIKVSGTRAEPKFGVRVRSVFKGKKGA